MVQSVYTRFSDTVQIAGVSMNVHQKGRVIYVCNSTVLSVLGIAGSDGSDGKTPDRPLATIKQALTLCVAGRGDKIILLPGHAETITAAAGINVAVAGVSIIADPSAVGAQRPTITYTTANTATLTIAANDVVISGVLFIANFLNVAKAINILLTATDVTISNCEFRDTDATHNFGVAVATSATANGQDGLAVIGCRMFGLGTTAVTALVLVGAAENRMVVSGNSVDITGATTTTAALIAAGANVLLGLRAVGNDVASSATTAATAQLITCGAGSGFVADNYISALGIAGADLLITSGSGMTLMNNFLQGAANVSGYELPVIDS